MTQAGQPEKHELDVRQLLALAHDKSMDSRRTLLENISDLFISAEGRLSERERSLMTGILNQLVRDVEMPVRKALAERLAGEKYAPRELVVALASDEIAIADPILRRSGVLQDSDLVEIVKTRTQEHRLAVASRETVSPEVAEALVETGDADVIEALINNHDAEISKRVMSYLVSESERVDRFQHPLLRRPDLPAQLAHRMFWWVGAALREHILSNYKIDPTTIDTIIHETTNRLQRAAAAERSVDAEAEFVVGEVASRGQLNERFLLQCLRRGRIAAFAAALARMAQIDIPLVRHIIFDPGGEALPVLCKACGIDRAVFSSIFLLTREAREGSRVTEPGKLHDMLRIYDKLSEQEAKGALAVWRLNGDYMAAVERIRMAEARMSLWSAPKPQATGA